MRPAISRAEAERIIDARVVRWLAVDNAYRNAEDAESQARREADITAEVERQVYNDHAVEGAS